MRRGVTRVFTFTGTNWGFPTLGAQSMSCEKSCDNNELSVDSPFSTYHLRYCYIRVIMKPNGFIRPTERHKTQIKHPLPHKKHNCLHSRRLNCTRLVLKMSFITSSGLLSQSHSIEHYSEHALFLHEFVKH